MSLFGDDKNMILNKLLGNLWTRKDLMQVTIIMRNQRTEDQLFITSLHL